MMLADVTSGGFSHGLFKWFKYQAEAQIDFTVMAYGNESIINYMANLKGLDPKLVRSFPIYGPASLAVSPKALLSVLKGEWDDFDLCHQHGIWNFSTLISLIWAKRTGKPVIIQPHGTLFPDTLAISATKKRIALNTYEGYNIKKAACIITTSENEKNAIKSLFKQKRVEVIKCLFDVPVLVSENIVQSILNKYRIQKENYWLYLGRIHPKKGIDLLIEAYKLLEERIPLVLVGPNEVPKYFKSIKKTIDDCGLSNEIKFFSEVPEIEKFALMRGAKAFILPTRSENFGTVVAEALGQQCPVICTKGAPWQTLETYKCGWWPDISIDGIADALRCSKSQTLIEKKMMGEQGPILLDKELNPYEIAKQTKQLYQFYTKFPTER